MNTLARPTLSPLWHRVATLRPRLRPQVEIARHIVRDAVWYVAYDKASNRSYRFSPSVYALLMRLDGSRTVDSVWSALAERMEEEAPSQDDVLRLLGQLYLSDMLLADGMVDPEELAERSQKQARKKVIQRFQNPLFLRVPLLDPDRFLTRTLPLVRPLFGPFGALLWLVAVGWLLVQAAVHWDALTADIAARVLAIDNLILIVLIFPILKAIHELGHGYATKLFGGEVHDVGLMFLVFLPVPYVDASASAVFPQKWKRILVASAGMLCEFVVAAIAMAVWISAEPGMVRALAFNTLLIATVSTVVFNGNPLLRFDAYYILSDMVEVPNLASRSNKYWTYMAQRRLFGLPNATNPAKAPGERGWFLFYAPASLIYRVTVLFGIAVFVSTTFFVVGVVLAVWTITISFLWPAIKGIGFVLFSDALSGNRPRAVLASGAVAAALAGLIFYLPIPHGTVATGIIRIPDESRIVTRSGGDVVSVLPWHGANIEAGMPVARLEDPYLQARRRVVDARLREVELRARAAEANAPFEVALYRQQETFLLAERRDIDARIDGLTVKTPIAGRFMAPKVADAMGRYSPRGEVIGHVVDDSVPIIQVAVSQEAVDLVRGATVGVTIRSASQPFSMQADVDLLREVPGATRNLPSPALSRIAGGPFALDPSAENSSTALFPIFIFELAAPSLAERPRFGERVHVRFDHGPSPIGPRLYRAGRQTFLRRFGV